MEKEVGSWVCWGWRGVFVVGEVKERGWVGKGFYVVWGGSGGGGTE